jgi:hypothetical protein
MQEGSKGRVRSLWMIRSVVNRLRIAVTNLPFFDPKPPIYETSDWIEIGRRVAARIGCLYAHSRSP